MKIIARIPAVAAAEARLTVLVPMPEAVAVPVPETPLEVSEPEVSEPVLATESPRESPAPTAKPPSHSKTEHGPKSKSKPRSKSKSKAKTASWTFMSPKSSRLKMAGFPTLSSVVLVLVAAAVWCLAAWNDLERTERHRRAERLARMPAADGSLSERILR